MAETVAHKFISNNAGDVFCEYCGIVTYSRSMTGDQVDQNRTEAVEGCPLGRLPKEKEES